MKKLILLTAGLFLACTLWANEPLFLVDFTNVSGKTKDWLKKNEFEAQKGFGRFPFEAKFQNNALYIFHKRKNFGLYGKEVKIEGAKKLRVTWGVDKFFSEGDDWLAGKRKIPVHVTLSFGEEKIDSGSTVIPNVPYFISFILSKNADNSKFYTGKFFKKGGRYHCASCPIEKGQVVVTEVDLLPVLQKAFGFKEIPVITLVSFGADTRETSFDGVSFIKKIEILN
jgi:hypothetical protein